MNHKFLNLIQKFVLIVTLFFINVSLIPLFFSFSLPPTKTSAWLVSRVSQRFAPKDRCYEAFHASFCISTSRVRKRERER